MRAAGKRKTRTKVGGHQDCAVCHPEQKSDRARERRAGKKACAEGRPQEPKR